MKEFLCEMAAVAIGVIVAAIVLKKVIKIDNWESDLITT